MYALETIHEKGLVFNYREKLTTPPRKAHLAMRWVGIVAVPIIDLSYQTHHAQEVELRQIYRDKNGSRIGYTDQSSHQTTAYRHDGSRLGYYLPRSDITYSANGSRIGIGNLLSALIWDAR